MQGVLLSLKKPKISLKRPGALGGGSANRGGKRPKRGAVGGVGYRSVRTPKARITSFKQTSEGSEVPQGQSATERTS